MEEQSQLIQLRHYIPPRPQKRAAAGLVEVGVRVFKTERFASQIGRARSAKERTPEKMQQRPVNRKAAATERGAQVPFSAPATPPVPLMSPISLVFAFRRLIGHRRLSSLRRLIGREGQYSEPRLIPPTEISPGASASSP